MSGVEEIVPLSALAVSAITYTTLRLSMRRRARKLSALRLSSLLSGLPLESDSLETDYPYDNLDSGSTEILPSDPVRVKQIFLDSIRKAKHEVLLLLPTTNSFHRQEKMGAISFSTLPPRVAL